MKEESYDRKHINCHNQCQMDRWIRFMELGAKTGCHQMPERSFTVKGYQFPVCARCCGVFLGYLVAPIAYWKLGFHRLKHFAFAGLLLMFLDWLLQAIHIKESNNLRRLLTGIAGGFGSMVVFLKVLGVVVFSIKKLIHK